MKPYQSNNRLFSLIDFTSLAFVINKDILRNIKRAEFFSLALHKRSRESFTKRYISRRLLCFQHYNFKILKRKSNFRFKSVQSGKKNSVYISWNVNWFFWSVKTSLRIHSIVYHLRHHLNHHLIILIYFVFVMYLDIEYFEMQKIIVENSLLLLQFCIYWISIQFKIAKE